MFIGILNSFVRQLKKILLFIAKIQTSIIMIATYYLIIGPMAILFQIFHRQKLSGKTYWIKKEPITDIDLYLTRQF